MFPRYAAGWSADVSTSDVPHRCAMETSAAAHRLCNTLGLLGLVAIVITTGLCEREHVDRRIARDEIFEAVDAGDVARVRLALECGAQVNAQKRTGMTPLGCAARAGRVDV